MVKCAIFALHAFLARFNASLLIRVIFILGGCYRQVHQQPQHRKHGGYITRDGVNTLFHHFLVFVVDFLAVLWLNQRREEEKLVSSKLRITGESLYVLSFFIGLICLECTLI